MSQLLLQLPSVVYLVICVHSQGSDVADEALTGQMVEVHKIKLCPSASTNVEVQRTDVLGRSRMI